jgi:hypothetical protein
MKNNSKKNYTVSIPLDLKNRLEYIKKLKKGKILMGEQITKILYPMVEKIEKINGINKDSWKTGVICENCSLIMVKKNGKNGDFWGCSDFPNCKFTKSLT